MSNKPRLNYSPKFRLEVAQEVVDKKSSILDVAESLDLGKPTVDKWTRQLRQERSGRLSNDPINSKYVNWNVN